MKSLDERLMQIVDLDWFFILVRQNDGDYLAIITKEPNGNYEFHGEADTPAEAVRLALLEAVGEGLPK